MTTATVEKPVSPLGSFIAKLPTKEKAPEVAKATDKPKEATDATNTAKTDAAAQSAATAVDQTAKTETGKTAEKSEAKTDDKPKDDVTEKRLKDAQTWGNEEHKARLKAERETADIKAHLARLEAKLDGTYVEPTAPSSDQLTFDAEMRGKLRASHRAAVRKHGEEHVMQQVWNPDSPYMKLQAANPRIGQRVLDSDDPVQEALDVLLEEEDAKKYGRTSEEMKKKIEEELKPKLTQEITQHILEGLKAKPGAATNTLGQVRGGSDRTDKPNGLARTTLAQIFPHGASRT